VTSEPSRVSSVTSEPSRVSSVTSEPSRAPAEEFTGIFDILGVEAALKANAAQNGSASAPASGSSSSKSSRLKKHPSVFKAAAESERITFAEAMRVSDEKIRERRLQEQRKQNAAAPTSSPLLGKWRRTAPKMQGSHVDTEPSFRPRPKSPTSSPVAPATVAVDYAMGRMIDSAQTANLYSAKSQKEKKALRKILVEQEMLGLQAKLKEKASAETRPTPVRRSATEEEWQTYRRTFFHERRIATEEEWQAHRHKIVNELMKNRGYDVGEQDEDSKNLLVVSDQPPMSAMEKALMARDERLNSENGEKRAAKTQPEAFKDKDVSLETCRLVSSMQFQHTTL